MLAAGARVGLLVPGAQADQGGPYAGGQQQGGALGQSPYTVPGQHRVEAHALEAFTAYLYGNDPAATAMCLEHAGIRIRYRQGDPAPTRT
ncbi:hypothetical protein [Streptomyces sp. NPDC050704]|uniref:hypothetical protein n=1 Tax=Streptomyces sp. NPDC050704 TaxID=3157219 RepID=UPI00342D412A